MLVILYVSYSIYIYIYLFGMLKPRRLVIKCKPLLIIVPCQFGYQFISILSSIFLFILFFLPNKLYIINIIINICTILWYI